MLEFVFNNPIWCKGSTREFGSFSEGSSPSIGKEVLLKTEREYCIEDMDKVNARGHGKNTQGVTK